MKKKICIFIITFIVMFFSCKQYGDAAVMYMYCPDLVGEGLLDSFDTPNAGYIFNYYGLPVFHSYNEGKLLPYTTQSEEMCWYNNKEGNGDCADADNQDLNIFAKKMCPIRARENIAGQSFNFFTSGVDVWQPFETVHTLILYGFKTPDPEDIKEIKDPVYAFYKYTYNGEEYIVGEGFRSDNGEYVYLNLHAYSEYLDEANEDNWFVSNWNDSTNNFLTFWDYVFDIDYDGHLKYFTIKFNNFYLLRLIQLSQKITGAYYNYYNIAEYPQLRNAFIWKDANISNYEEIVTSKNQKKMEEALDKWYEAEGLRFEKLGNYIDFTKDTKINSVSDDLIETVQYGSAYQFKKSYTASDLLTDLEKTYELLLLASEELNDYIENQNFGDLCAEAGEIENPNLTDAAKCYAFKQLFGTPKIEDLRKNGAKVNEPQYLRQMIYQGMDKYIKERFVYGEKNGVELWDYINDNKTFVADVERYMNVISYFNFMSNHTDLSEADKARLSELNDKMIEFAETYDIYPNSFSCSQLIGDNLNDKIISYFNIIRIIVPILVIGFGIYEYFKVLFLGDADSMNKTHKTFLKRIGISILFFLTPTIVELVLKLANLVWLNINPDTCITFH